MSYTFPNANSRLIGDHGASGTFAYPYFVAQFVKAATWPADNRYLTTLQFKNADPSSLYPALNNTIRLQLGRFMTMTFGSDPEASPNAAFTPSIYMSDAESRPGQWIAVVTVWESPTSRTMYLGQHGAGIEHSGSSTTEIVIDSTDYMRYLVVGGFLPSTFTADNIQLAEIVVGRHVPTTTEVTDYINGTAASAAFSTANLQYYPLNVDATSHDDVMGNGPTISAAGAVSYNADHPTITSPASGGTPPFVSVTVS